MKKVSVVIPVLNAEPFLAKLLDQLFAQAPLCVKEVILVDSMSTDATREIASCYKDVRIVLIENFSHGRARNLGVREACSETVVLMTQDALPADACWLARLLEPFSDERVGATFSRQVPRSNASIMEQFFLKSHFPSGEAVRREKKGHETLTLEKVFFSNVSAAVRREHLLAYPFDETLIMSEDQQFARDLLEAGFASVYQPSSVVVHSHNYTLSDVVRRYFDSVYSLTQIFPKHGVRTSCSMGGHYLFKEIIYVLRKRPWVLPYYFLYTAAKICGTLAGHFVAHMPLRLVKKLSLHRYHWESKQV